MKQFDGIIKDGKIWLNTTDGYFLILTAWEAESLYVLIGQLLQEVDSETQ